MQTFRRLYLYTVAFLSLGVVLLGMIWLVPFLVRDGQTQDGSVRLAESLSLLLVGLPVFLLHGWLAQRSAARDSTERSSRVRAIFLYGILFATLLFALFNFLAIVNRSLLSFFEADPSQALLGGDQTGLDNLGAFLVGLAGFGLVLLLLKADWGKPLLGNAFVETRRLYRLLWLVAGVALIVYGLSLVFESIIGRFEGSERISQVGLANGLSLFLVGMPLWFFASRLVDSSLSVPAESRSFLRLAVYYALAFVGLSGLLLTGGFILEALLRPLLNAGQALPELLGIIRHPLSIVIPLGAVWAYYERQLGAERREEIAPAIHRRLHRLYRAVFAFLGLAAMIVGLHGLLDFGLASALNGSAPAVSPLGADPALALAFLLVGFPVWFFFWRAMQAEANIPGEVGDRARLSLVRKAYLYGVLFLAVSGLMVAAGRLVTPLLQSTMVEPARNLPPSALPGLKDFLLFALVLAYHGWILRRDARLSERSLTRRRTLYPVLVLVTDEGDFARRMVSALEHYLPGLPIAVHPVSNGAPDETLSAAKAVILPFEILAKPPEAVRLWLQSFAGERLVVPSNVDHWFWVAGSRLSPRDPAQQAALAILEWVEGNRSLEE